MLYFHADDNNNLVIQDITLITYDNVVMEFLKEFPEAIKKAEEEKIRCSSNGEYRGYQYVFFGYVVTWLTINALNNNDNPKLLSRLFRFFETMAESSEAEIIDLLKWGTLEIVGDDKKILKHARSLMGKNTLALSHDTERYWGRE